MGRAPANRRGDFDRKEDLSSGSPAPAVSIEAFVRSLSLDDPQDTPSEFDKNGIRLINLAVLRNKGNYIALVTELFGLTAQEADQEYEERISARFNPVSKRRFADRPAGEDAIEFYTSVWSKDVLNGSRFKEDIEAEDSAVLVGVTNRCNYLARKDNVSPAAFYPKGFPPPERPFSEDENKTRAKELARNRQARRRAALRGHSPD